MPRGYGISDTKNWTDFKVHEFDLKKETDEDVEIAITHCGVAAQTSTLSRVAGALSRTTSAFPATRSSAPPSRSARTSKGIKVGDRVGVGAQVDSCGECVPCKDQEEQYCQGKNGKGMVDTYNSVHHCGTQAQGGYSTHNSYPAAVRLPHPRRHQVGARRSHALRRSHPLLAPHSQRWSGPGKRVGIVGIGGLGHFGVMFAHALGAEVVAISHSPRKREDALKMGRGPSLSRRARTPSGPRSTRRSRFDLIINTASSNAVDLASILSTLKVHGRLICVGMPGGRVQGAHPELCRHGMPHGLLAHRLQEGGAPDAPARRRQEHPALGRGAPHEGLLQGRQARRGQRHPLPLRPRAGHREKLSGPTSCATPTSTFHSLLFSKSKD
ncbi:hypothetical protein L1887_61999 [Cichorium endivia]|nr:hypothetical protein L1887_61999 [Cichorium endivia]